MSASNEGSPKDNILLGKLSEMTEVMAVHMETSKTQIDIRDDIIKMVTEHIS
jgi:hypothetical protein